MRQRLALSRSRGSAEHRHAAPSSDISAQGRSSTLYALGKIGAGLRYHCPRREKKPLLYRGARGGPFDESVRGICEDLRRGARVRRASLASLAALAMDSRSEKEHPAWPCARRVEVCERSSIEAVEAAHAGAWLETSFLLVDRRCHGGIWNGRMSCMKLSSHGASPRLSDSRTRTGQDVQELSSPPLGEITVTHMLQNQHAPGVRSLQYCASVVVLTGVLNRISRR